MEQQIRFCITPDGVRIAYATMGEGPPLVKAAHWLSHLQFEVESPVWRHWVRELSRYHLYVRYDERGCGLSDWEVKDFSFEAWVRDLETVVDSIGLNRFVLFGLSQGGPVSIAYTVRHPERVSHLILYGAYSRGWAKRNLRPEEIEEREALVKLTRLGWGRDNPRYRQIFTSTFIPDATTEQMRWFNDLQRVSASAENAARFQMEFSKIDVSGLLSQVSVPTLVLHARDDAAVPFESGREIAALIPDARFIPLEGKNHILLEDEPAWGKFLYHVRRFVGVKEEGQVEPSSFSRQTQTIMWRDSLSSVEEAQIHSLIAGLNVVNLSLYRVVGNYVRYEEDVHNALKDAKQKIFAGFGSLARRRENHLIWAPPGSGKTYFVQQVATSLQNTIRYNEFNLAKLNKQDFTTKLASLEKIDEPCLCFVDEVDAKPAEPWPYEALLPYLDAAAEGALRLVFVLAGSSGSSLNEMKKRIANRPKGTDLLNRIPSGNEYSIPPMSIGDRILVALRQFTQAGKELSQEVRAIEKLGLYYVALNPDLASPRQLREFAVRCAERIPHGEDRIKYDYLFNLGDPENKVFWMKALPTAEDLLNKFVILED